VLPARYVVGLAMAIGIPLCVPAPARAGAFVAPGFVRFGWLSPPNDSTNDAHVAEMAAAGLDLMLPAQDDSGDRVEQLHRLDLAATHGLRCIVWDSRFASFYRLDVDSPAGQARMDSIVADYRDHPAMFAYYMGDEPRAPWALHRKIADALRLRDPGHPIWNNLLGRGSWPDTASWLGYTRSYLDSIPARILCNDHYEFRTDGDPGIFFENAAGLRATAEAYGMPFWAIILLVQHRGYRAVTPGMLRWQVGQLLAYGCRGVGYFTWWTPAPDTVWDWHDAVIRTDGTRSSWYDVVSDLDRDAGAVGNRLAAMRWVSTQCTDPAPSGADLFRGDDWVTAIEGRLTIGRFVDGAGNPHVICVNRDSLATGVVTVHFRGLTGVMRLDPAVGVWMPQALAPSGASADERQLRLVLDPGDFALLRLDGTRGEAVGRVGPRLAVAATPAHGVARIRVAHLDAGARLDLFDAGGRRVRSWSPPPGDGVIEWDGGDDSGARMPAGLYLARVRDARGEATTRITWLGR
jgi:hypothetical protein